MLKLSYKFERINNNFQTIYKTVNEVTENVFIAENINYLSIKYMSEKFIL
jgi:1-deoxy-D-xylulose 5-phosphate reductoisomerase